MASPLCCLASASHVSFLQIQSQARGDGVTLNHCVISVACTDGLGDGSEKVPLNPSGLRLLGSLAQLWKPCGGACGKSWSTRGVGTMKHKEALIGVHQPWPSLSKALVNHLPQSPLHRTTYKCIKESPLLSEAASATLQRHIPISTPSSLPASPHKVLLNTSDTARKSKRKAHPNPLHLSPLLQRAIKCCYPSAGSLRHSGHCQPL